MLYHSYGDRFSDNPRAICEELLTRRPNLIHVSDCSRRDSVPDGIRVASLYSTNWLRAAGRARYVVANTSMPNNFENKRGAFYLQTWHGTPLKRIGADNPRWSRRDLRRFLREARRWDVLVSQNRFSTEVFRHAFRYDGEILESGYPRNDVLNAPDRHAIRARLRSRLGIGEQTTAVLYAPTFRDDQIDTKAGHPFSLALDVELMQRELGESHVLLLRLHPVVSGSGVQLSNPMLRDVSQHLDVAELYLATDVLITDYSSAMFDFAVTEKPMLFYTYDLESYRDALRGFYFDFEAEAPGPLLESTEDVIAALGATGKAKPASDGHYTRFRDRYCYLEDGRASQRVVDRMLSSP